MLVGAVVDLDDVVERRLEEGELPENHCGERERGGTSGPTPPIAAACIAGAWQR